LSISISPNGRIFYRVKRELYKIGIQPASDPHIHAKKYTIRFSATDTIIVPLSNQKNKEAVRPIHRLRREVTRM